MSIAKPRVYLDLDRTIFDTDKASMLWHELAKHYDLIPEACHADRERFYVWPVPGTYYHDMSAQLEAYGIYPPEAFEILRCSPLADGRLQLPYTDQLIHALRPLADLVVLTFGADDYQHLKAALCPALNGIPVITTSGEKRAILKEAGECWLVDDKPLGEHPPKNVHYIQIAPPGGTVHGNTLWPFFSNLKEVKEYLYEALH